MLPIRVLVLGEVSQDAIARLAGRCELELLPQGRPSARQLACAQIIVVRSHVEIGEELLGMAPGLNLIVRAGAGLDNVDLIALRRHGVRLCHLGGNPSARAVAELAMAHTLHLLRRVGIANAGISRGQWLKPGLTGKEIYQRPVAVWGYGPVGSCIADLFSLVGADVRVHTRSGKTAPFAHEPSLAKLASWADVHVLALPHNAETAGLLSPALLSLMACRHPVVVNMGRPQVADFSALVAALESGAIAGLGIDPLTPGDLETVRQVAQRTDLNTVFTPHLGATTSETLERMGSDIVSAILDYLGNEPHQDGTH